MNKKEKTGVEFDQNIFEVYKVPELFRHGGSGFKKDDPNRPEWADWVDDISRYYDYFKSARLGDLIEEDKSFLPMLNKLASSDDVNERTGLVRILINIHGSGKAVNYDILEVMDKVLETEDNLKPREYAHSSLRNVFDAEAVILKKIESDPQKESRRMQLYYLGYSELGVEGEANHYEAARIEKYLPTKEEVLMELKKEADRLRFFYKLPKDVWDQMQGSIPALQSYIRHCSDAREYHRFGWNEADYEKTWKRESRIYDNENEVESVFKQILERKRTEAKEKRNKVLQDRSKNQERRVRLPSVSKAVEKPDRVQEIIRESSREVMQELRRVAEAWRKTDKIPMIDEKWVLVIKSASAMRNYIRCCADPSKATEWEDIYSQNKILRNNTSHETALAIMTDIILNGEKIELPEPDLPEEV